MIEAIINNVWSRSCEQTMDDAYSSRVKAERMAKPTNTAPNTFSALLMHQRQRRQPVSSASLVTSAFLASSIPTSLAQSCISLKGSDACPAFNASSISTSSGVVGLFPFLSDVTDLASFDSGLQDYIGDGWAQVKYVDS